MLRLGIILACASLVVGCEAGAVEADGDVAGDVGEGGCVPEAFGGETVDVGGADVALGLDERVPFVDNLAVEVDGDDGDLDNAVAVVDAGGFAVDDRDSVGTAGERGEGSGAQGR